MYEIGKRIKKVREDKGISQKDFAISIGVGNTTVANWEKGLTRPDVDTLALICNTLNVSPDTLLDIAIDKDTTEHPLLQKYNSLDPHGKEVVDSVLSIEYERIQQNNKVIEIQKKYPIQEYEERVSAGTGNNLDYASAFITELDYEPPKCADFIVRVAGDSMEPTYSDGDRLFIHRTKDFNYGDIGIFYVPQDGLVVKEYAADGLVSHNKDYEVIKATDGIEYIGKVIGKVK